MPPLSDFRSDSPLNFICVACWCLGSSEDLNRVRIFTVAAVVRFCCHRGVRGFHDPRSVHHASSHTRSCLQPHSCPWFSASSDLRNTGVTAVIKLSLEPTQRHSLSARSFTLAGVEPGVDLNTLRSCLPEYRVVPVGLFAKTMALASAYCRGPRV
jgi:hypothetical protein